MLFTVQEMEILCIFYDESRAKTIDNLRHVLENISANISRRREDVESCITKLEAMRPSGTACIQFND